MATVTLVAKSFRAEEGSDPGGGGGRGLAVDGPDVAPESRPALALLGAPVFGGRRAPREHGCEEEKSARVEGSERIRARKERFCEEKKERGKRARVEEVAMVPLESRRRRRVRMLVLLVRNGPAEEEHQNDKREGNKFAQKENKKTVIFFSFSKKLTVAF
jgi:hypothetical protein